MTLEPIAPGLHESLLTTELQKRLAMTSGLEVATGQIDSADLAHVLAQHVYASAHRAFTARSAEEAVTLANQLIDALQETGTEVAAPASQLLRIAPTPGPGVVTYPDVRPRTPLAEAALMTNAKSEPSLGPELRTEVDTADHVDLLCAFVRWAGLRLLDPELRRLRERGGRLRVITTTYTGSTERRALDHLVREYDAEVRVQYDAQRTRLHAKAWMFHRNTGFDTAYVGSSNLTHTAMLEGVEWNVRLSRVATPSLLEKFNATFDTYWNDAAFETYQPSRDADRLDLALAEAGGRTNSGRVTLSLSGLAVTPYPYQQEMLDEIDAERAVHDRNRNLVVAATGTGKTVVAALDYRRLATDPSRRPSLLFVAHRKEILTQSLRTYREVLANANFGELYVDGAFPKDWKHVFASVQSLSAYGIENLPADAFDIVVIDEFHHAAAKTYRALLKHLAPKELLGLTATPERADGINVRDAFFDGRIATELRLWDALGAELLCPFHYFGVADNTDLSQLSWKQGAYDDAELSNLFTGNDARTRIILKQLQEKVLDTGSMRALGFCVTIEHARYMAAAFNEAGISARAVTGNSTADERAAALVALRDSTVNILFTVDLFNEGLDIPNVDTILFLRPTESATVFLQQLGRGLRRTAEKAVLTVLDFVGHQHKRFRWDLKLTALTGLSRSRLGTAVDQEFPFLPSGCQIVMDKETQAAVLANLKTQIGSRWSDLLAELRSIGNVDLREYLNESGAALPDLLKSGRSWTRLRREAGFEARSVGPREDELVKRGRSLIHVDDRQRAATYQSVLSSVAEPTLWSPAERRLAEMLFFSLWPNGGGFSSIEEGIRSLHANDIAAHELSTIVDLGFENARRTTLELSGDLAGVPLQVHGRYRREEVLAALGDASLAKPPINFREGVLWVPEINTDAFFIQLKKSEAAFSPTTMYQDYPISPTLFHWESQSRTTISSPTGQRYLNGTSNVLLFVRETAVDEYGTGAPYLFLGPATYVKHEGERPIAITWKLQTPMPIDFFTAAKVVAS
jgi:superfamily II DNA or RNA helicase/HKD family nuclease